MKIFTIGEKLLAADLNGNFADNVKEYEGIVSSNLVCGSSGSLANFQLVDDGSFKVSIGETEYHLGNGEILQDDTDLVTNGVGTINYELYDGNARAGQTFTLHKHTKTMSGIFLSVIRGNLGGGVISIYEADGSGHPTGTALVPETSFSFGSSSYASFTYVDFGSDISVDVTKRYVVIYRIPSSVSNYSRLRYNTNIFDGKAIESNDAGATWTDVIGGKQFGILVKGTIDVNKLDFTDETSFSGVATVIQNVLRTNTGKLETVIYDTDHFKITTEYSFDLISQLSAGTSGTDISGSSYLNGLSGTVTDISGSFNTPVTTDETGYINDGLVKYRITPSATSQTASMSTVSVSSLEPIKVKEIKYNGVSGSLRTSFQLDAPSYYLGTIYGQLYKNGIAVGTLRSVSHGDSNTTFTQDISVETGDFIQLYSYVSEAPNSNIGDFYLAYDLTRVPVSNDIIQ